MSFSINRGEHANKSDFKKIGIVIHEPPVSNDDSINCFTHQKNSTNICIFLGCNDPVLCPKCISLHNQTHFSKILPIQDVLFDRKESLTCNVEQTLGEIRNNLAYFQKIYGEKNQSLQEEINLLCKAARDTFLKQLSHYQERALGAVQQQYERISSSMLKMQGQLDQQRGFLNNFLGKNLSSEVQRQQIKDLIHYHSQTLPSIKENFQKVFGDFNNFSVKVHSKEFLEHFDNNLKSVFYDVDNLISFIHARKSRISISPGVMQRSSIANSYGRNQSIQPQSSFFTNEEENQSEPNPFGQNMGETIPFKLESVINESSIVLSLCTFKDSENIDLIAAGGSDSIIKIWNPFKRNLVQNLKGHEGGVRELLYVQQYRILVSGGLDNLIKLWDQNSSFINTRTLRGHSDYIRGLSYIEERSLISCSEDKSIRIWDITTGELSTVFMGHAKAVYCIFYIKEKGVLLSGSGDHSIKYWSFIGKECMKTIEKAHSGFINAITYKSGNNVIITGSSDKTIKIFDFKNGTLLNTLKGHTGYVCCLKLIEEGKILASASADHLIKFWNLEKMNCIKTFKSHKKWVYSLIEIKDMKAIASGGADNNIIIWRKPPEGDEDEDF